MDTIMHILIFIIFPVGCIGGLCIKLIMQEYDSRPYDTDKEFTKL